MNDFLELTQGLLEKNDFEDKPNVLEDGDYIVEVNNIQKRTSQNGNEYVSVVLKITDGDATGRLIFDNVFFTAKTAEGNIKRIYKLAQMSNLELVTFTDIDSIVSFLTGIVGNTYNVSYAENNFHKVTYNAML